MERSEEWLATVGSGVDAATSGNIGPTGDSWAGLYVTYAKVLEDGKDGEMSLGKTILFWASVVFSVIVVIAGIALAIYACTCGRPYVFAKDCLERLKKEMDDKTPEDIKQYVATRAFKAKCEQLFINVDVDGTGIVEWENELNKVPFDEWGDDLRWDQLYKELNDACFTSVTVSREDWCAMCQWFEYIKHDIATNGLKEGEGLGVDAQKPDEPNEDGVAAPEPEAPNKDGVAAPEPEPEEVAMSSKARSESRKAV